MSVEVYLSTREMRYLLERLSEPRRLSAPEKSLLTKLEAFGPPKDISPNKYKAFLTESEEEIAEMILTAIRPKGYSSLSMDILPKNIPIEMAPNIRMLPKSNPVLDQPAFIPPTTPMAPSEEDLPIFPTME